MGAPTITPLNENITPDPPKNEDQFNRSHLADLYPKGRRDMSYARVDTDSRVTPVPEPKIIPRLSRLQLAKYGMLLIAVPLALDSVMSLFIAPNFWGMAMTYLPFLVMLLFSGGFVLWLVARHITKQLNLFDVNATAYVSLYICTMSPLLYVLRGAASATVSGGVNWVLLYGATLLLAGGLVMVMIGRIDQRFKRRK